MSAQPWPGQVNLRGLRPLVRAEIQCGMFVHTQRARPARWDLGWIRSLVMTCRTLEVDSLVDFEFGAGGSAAFTGAIAKEILHELRLVYFTPVQAREAGSLETEHFGVLFPHRMSHFDLTGIPQRWPRDLTWDFIADLLRSPGCPRTASPVDGFRRAAVELGVFLELEAPGGGHDPGLLRREHMDRLIADQRHREREALPSLAIRRPGGAAGTVTTTTRSMVFNIADTRVRTAPDLAGQDVRQEATWRERALNAEDALKAAHAEIVQQRARIGELLGQVRDLQAEWTQEATQRVTTENTTLKQRVRQLTADNRTLDERLKAARSNLRFQDRRIADLQARLLDPPAK